MFHSWPPSCRTLRPTANASIMRVSRSNARSKCAPLSTSFGQVPCTGRVPIAFAFLVYIFMLWDAFVRSYVCVKRCVCISVTLVPVLICRSLNVIFFSPFSSSSFRSSFVLSFTPQLCSELQPQVIESASIPLIRMHPLLHAHTHARTHPRTHALTQANGLIATAIW